MQKQRMNRAMAFIASVGAALGFGRTSDLNNPYKDLKLKGKTHPGRRTQPSFWNTGNPDGYGMALVSSPRYRSYKRKRNRRARAANGGVLPKKLA